MRYEIQINGVLRSVEFDRSWKAVSIDGQQIAVNAARISPGVYSILVGGRSFDVTVENTSAGLSVRTGGREFHVEIFDPRSWRRGRGASVVLEGRQQVIAPMPGKIVGVLAMPGQQVDAGQGLLVIEAMKMQNEIRAPKSGTVEQLAQQGQTVNAGEILAVVV